MIKETTRHSLDTLELTSHSFLTESHERLIKASVRKASTISKLVQLIDVSNNEWSKKYWKAFHCNNVFIQQGDKLKGSLCRKRWCQHCSRIHTAELITGYSKPLQELQQEQDLYFVTLTAPTVKARELSNEIKKRYKAFTRIKNNLRVNYSIGLIGARKLEITYNEENDKYHPHFHFIQQGKREAELLQDLWLKQFPNASLKAQDIRLIDANDTDNLVEIFKYATKQVITSDKTAKALHTIYQSLDGKRVFQTYGKLSKIQEPRQEQEEVSNCDFIPPNDEIWVYNLPLKDYDNAKKELLFNTLDYMELLE